MKEVGYIKAKRPELTGPSLLTTNYGYKIQILSSQFALTRPRQENLT